MAAICVLRLLPIHYSVGNVHVLSTCINLSVDLGLFDRINTTLTYYHNKGYDLLGEAHLDPTVGYSEQLINSADMNNSGVEVQLDADLIRTRDFTWNVGWVFGYNEKLYETALTIPALY